MAPMSSDPSVQHFVINSKLLSVIKSPDAEARKLPNIETAPESARVHAVGLISRVLRRQPAASGAHLTTTILVSSHQK